MDFLSGDVTNGWGMASSSRKRARVSDADAYSDVDDCNSLKILSSLIFSSPSLPLSHSLFWLTWCSWSGDPVTLSSSEVKTRLVSGFTSLRTLFFFFFFFLLTCRCAGEWDFSVWSRNSSRILNLSVSLGAGGMECTFFALPFLTIFLPAKGVEHLYLACSSSFTLFFFFFLFHLLISTVIADPT